MGQKLVQFPRTFKRRQFIKSTDVDIIDENLRNRPSISPRDHFFQLSLFNIHAYHLDKANALPAEQALGAAAIATSLRAIHSYTNHNEGDRIDESFAKVRLIRQVAIQAWHQPPGSTASHMQNQAEQQLLNINFCTITVIDAPAKPDNPNSGQI